MGTARDLCSRKSTLPLTTVWSSNGIQCICRVLWECLRRGLPESSDERGRKEIPPAFSVSKELWLGQGRCVPKGPSSFITFIVLVGMGFCQSSPPTGGPPGNTGATAQMPIIVPQIGNINFAKPGELVIALRPDQTAAIYVEVVSDQDSYNSIQFYLSVVRGSDSTPCRGSAVSLPTAPGFRKNTPRPIPIEVTGCGDYVANGVLGILGSSGTHKEIPIVLRRRRSVGPPLGLALSLVLALVIAMLCAFIVTDHGHKLTDVIGNASWNFASSWASNITAFGTAYAAVLQLTIFPDKPVLGSRMEYAFLIAFALALVALAPVAQRLTSRISVDRSGSTPAVITVGLVGGFLFASAFTMWGTFLQIATLCLLGFELGNTATLDLVTTVVAELCVALAGVGLVIYCWRTILSTVAANSTRTGTKRGTHKPFQFAPVDAATAQSRKVALL
jgi:hypothetical protein